MRLDRVDGHGGVNSGEPPQAMQSARTQTNGTVILLTSRRSSGDASRRRVGGGEGDRRGRSVRVCGARGGARWRLGFGKKGLGAADAPYIGPRARVP
jgi:hypothetical protein